LTAKADTKFIKVCNINLKRLLKEEVIIQELILSRQIKKLEELYKRFESLSDSYATSRTIDFLVKHYVLNEGQTKPIFTHSDISNYTGVTRQGITTVLRALKSKLVIDYNRSEGIKVLNSELILLYNKMNLVKLP